MSMPSRAVDIAWHEFILVTRVYNEFCHNAIGRFLHHTPAEEMDSNDSLIKGMSRTWNLACEWEGINPESPTHMPFLFAIDQALNIPNGSIHALDNNYAVKLDESTQYCCG